MMSRTLLLLLLVSSVTLSCTPKAYVYQEPPQVKGDWETSTLAKAKLPEASLVEMVNQTRQGHYKNIHSILLVKDGKLVLEEYFHGHNAQTLHDLRSTTKSITSLLVGLGIQKKHLPNELQTIPTYLPKYAKRLTGKKRSITLQHLLTMSSGLDCNDHNPNSPAQEDKMYRTSDWLDFLLKVNMVAEPGKKYSYCTGGVVLLGAILQQASNMSIPSFAQKYLFGPLGITKVKWSPAAPKGYTDTGGHLYLRPRDMAKIGWFVHQNGMWNGKSVLSSSWFGKIKNPYHAPQGYSYLWWYKKARNQATGTTYTIHHSSGNGGQFIYIIPELKLVAVFTGGNYNSPLMNQPINMLAQHLFKPLAASK